MTPSKASVAAAFAAVYVLWGSTFLFIRFAVETIPPFLMGGARFLLAGVLLYAWARLRGAAPLTPRQWRGAAVVGLLLMGMGNGAVVWAEQHSASSVAPLLVAASPFWSVLIEWLRPGGHRPRPAVVAGLLVGLAGVAVLIGPARLEGGGADLLGIAAVLAGTVAWSSGSMYSRPADRPASPLLGTAASMLCGGAFLLVIAISAGELARFDPARVSTRSAVGFVYLLTAGSLIGFSAYVWLLGVSTPARVATYAYVNPLVAVFLGWAVGGEPVGTRMLTASAVILGGVALITSASGPPKPPAESSEVAPVMDQGE